MEYTVRKGDTIAAVTKLLGTDWQTLKKLNPEAIGKSRKNGNWFLKEGKEVSVQRSFDSYMAEEMNSHSSSPRRVSTPAGAAAETGREVLHTVQPGDTIWEMAVKKYHVHPEDIISLNKIEDPRKIQPGTVLRIPLPEKGEPGPVVASWYGSYHHGLPMANGEPYDMFGETVAHKDIPLGTVVELENPRTGEKARAVVADRGPYVEGRDVDLSYELARRLSLVRQGVGNLRMRIL